jgi:murein DD-endopeptidase MepM/ murein hydrolase activator NlpD
VTAERITGTTPASAAEPAQKTQTIDKATVARLAAEFESLLLSSIFRDMRSAGRWSDDEDSGDMLGAGAFNQTFDTELARTLSKAGGFGLSGFLQQALDRYAGGTSEATPASAGTQPAITPSMLPAIADYVSRASRTTPGDEGLDSAATAVMAPVATPVPTTADLVRGARSAARAVIRETPATTASGLAELERPTARLTSAFGWRKDPLTGAAKFHSGVDLKAAEGDPVGATGAGRVVFSGRNGGYGNSVVIEHANGVRTRYAHLSALLVAVGDQVSEGQPIGLAGHTGRATGPHVHYEVLEHGRAVDPLR